MELVGAAGWFVVIGQILTVDMHPGCTREKGELTAEVLELVDEVRALEDTEQVLRDTIALQKDLNKILADKLNQRDAELDVIREQLATEISRRTLGGSPPGYSNSKFTGPTPPPYISEDKAS